MQYGETPQNMHIILLTGYLLKIQLGLMIGSFFMVPNMVSLIKLDQSSLAFANIYEIVTKLLGD
jgi:hypothetical protein